MNTFRPACALRIGLLSAATLLVSSSAVGAQQQAQDASSALPANAVRAPSCVATLPDSALVPAVLYLTTGDEAMLDSVARARTEEIDLFAQLVANRFRSLLTTTPNVVPAGEPAITWRTKESAIQVVVDRNGRFVSRPPVSTDEHPDILGTAQRSQLLSVALDSVRADGEVLAFAAGPADSVKFYLWLTTAFYGEDGKLVPPKARAGFPVATLRAPPARRARPLKFVHPDFPLGKLGHGVGVNLTMRFVVDSTGKVDPATIQDVWPEGVPRQLGGSAAVYDAFVRAARRSILRSTFEPARIGACMVSETSQIDFTGTPIR